MSKKVLVISQYFLPDINAASYRMADLYAALQKLQMDTTVVTAYPQKFAVEEVKEEKNIHRIQLAKVTKKSFFSYLNNYFGFMFKVIFYCLFRLRKEKFDYIIVTSPPLFVAFSGVVVAFFKRTKLIVDIRDIWPDSAVSAGMLKRNGLLHRLTKWLEKLIYRRARKITCVSQPMKADIYEKSSHRQIHVLYNGVSPESFQRESDCLLPVTSSKKITIGYAGNIGIVQNMDILLQVAKMLHENNEAESYEFLIIGDGIERKRLESEVKRLGLNNITFTGTLTKEDTLERLTQVDCLFFSLIADPVFETTIPSKLFDYLLSNKPLITSIKGEGRDILTERGCALFFAPDSPESLLQALHSYKQNKEQLDKLALHNRQYVIENFNREAIFIEFLQDL